MIKMFQENGQEAVYLDTLIDQNFINLIEVKNEKVRFVRIDSDIAATLKSEGVVDAELGEKAIELFKEALGETNIEYSAEAMKNAQTPAILLVSEETRRVREMYERYKMSGATKEFDIDAMFPVKYKMVLNSNSDIIAKLVEKKEDKELVKLLAEQIFDIAKMNIEPLKPEEMEKFTKRSLELVEKLV